MKGEEGEDKAEKNSWGCKEGSSESAGITVDGSKGDSIIKIVLEGIRTPAKREFDYKKINIGLVEKNAGTYTKRVWDLVLDIFQLCNILSFAHYGL